ncbi:MAG: hypothetical protein AB1505_31820 [Candidatus Latescibacterota bacterium]
MDDPFASGRTFLLTHARLLERMLFEVRFGGAPAECVGRAVRAYQNADGGLGHGLEPDFRCPDSQPLFAEVGLAALWEAGCRQAALALDLCRFLGAVAQADGLLPPALDSAFAWPRAAHWRQPWPAGLNPTAALCGLLHYQGVEHPWLDRATQTCCRLLLGEPPAEAHALLCATRLADHLPDRELARRLAEGIAAALPHARFFLPQAPVTEYGLTPLHFAPRPDSPWRALFTDSQIRGHLDDLLGRQQPDGGWPISWEPPGPAAALEWRGRGTLEALGVLTAYGRIPVPRDAPA